MIELIDVALANGFSALSSDPLNSLKRARFLKEMGFERVRPDMGWRELDLKDPKAVGQLLSFVTSRNVNDVPKNVTGRMPARTEAWPSSDSFIG
jgi:hypothetical protein